MNAERKSLLLDVSILLLAMGVFVTALAVGQKLDPVPVPVPDPVGCPCPQNGAECTGTAAVTHTLAAVTFSTANWDTSSGTYWDGTNKNRLNGPAAASTPLLVGIFSFPQSANDGVFTVALYVGTTQVAIVSQFVPGGKAAFAGTLCAGKVQLPANGTVRLYASQTADDSANGTFTLDMEF